VADDLIARIEAAMAIQGHGTTRLFARAARTLLPECASHIESLELSYGGACDTADELKEENRRLLDALKTARTALEMLSHHPNNDIGSYAGTALAALAELDAPAAETNKQGDDNDQSSNG
jgi:hypothetical protein